MYFNLGDFERLTLIILIAHRETAKTRLLMSEEQIAMTDTCDVYMTTADSTEDMDVHKGGPCIRKQFKTEHGGIASMGYGSTTYLGQLKNDFGENKRVEIHGR